MQPTNKVQVILSLLLIGGYIFILGSILYIETSDTLNLVKGENSFMGELKLLLGVLSASVSQVLYFWFSDKRNDKKSE